MSNNRFSDRLPVFVQTRDDINFMFANDQLVEKVNAKLPGGAKLTSAERHVLYLAVNTWSEDSQDIIIPRGASNRPPLTRARAMQLVDIAREVDKNFGKLAALHLSAAFNIPQPVKEIDENQFILDMQAELVANPLSQWEELVFREAIRRKNAEAAGSKPLDILVRSLATTMCYVEGSIPQKTIDFLRVEEITEAYWRLSEQGKADKGQLLIDALEKLASTSNGRIIK